MPRLKEIVVRNRLRTVPTLVIIGTKGSPGLDPKEFPGLQRYAAA